MFQGLLALLGRSLRIDSRSWQVHLARVGLLLAIYISLTYAFATSTRFGAPGLRFFRAILWLNTIFATLLGIGFFSTAISEEKEEDTLGLMQMAGIIPLGILLGKVGGRLCQALLLIVVQYPFTLLAVTMGGVTPNQIQCAFVGLTSYVLMLSGLGLLCSTIAANNRSASVLMIAGLVIYLAVPYFAYETHQGLVNNGLLAPTSLWAKVLWQVGSTCLFLQITTIMTSAFGESPWSIQAISNGLGGAVCFLTAWASFALCTANPTTEAASRGLLARKTNTLRWFAPGRPGANPFLWKDYHFVGGGHGMTLVRIGFYLALLVISFLLTEIWWGRTGMQSTYAYQWTIGLYQVLLLPVIAIETSVLAARTLHDEFRGQTLGALLMLPANIVVTTYSKLAGALLAAIPGVTCLLLASFGFEGGRENMGEFLRESAGWFLLAHFALIPHLSMVLAIQMRWGFVPLAIGISVASLFAWISLFEASRIGPSHGLVWLATMTVCVICLSCHVWLALRLPSAAARV